LPVCSVVDFLVVVLVPESGALLLVVVVDSDDFSDLVDAAGAPCAPVAPVSPLAPVAPVLPLAPVAPAGPGVVVVSLHPTPRVPIRIVITAMAIKLVVLFIIFFMVVTPLWNLFWLLW
jgi:hypothetical protein